DAGSSLAGIAVSADNATAAQGVWQYMKPGGQWHNIGTVDLQHAIALSADTLIRFVPAQNFNGTPGNLQVHALDNTYGGAFTTDSAAVTIDASLNGGSTAISAAAANLGETVTQSPFGINEGPQTASVSDAGSWFATGQFTASDPDNSPLTWTIVG